MLSGVQTRNGSPHGKYNIRGIPHARTKRKDDIFMQRRLVQNFTYIMEWGQGTCTLTKRTRRWTYSALRHFLYSNSIWTQMHLRMEFDSGVGPTCHHYFLTERLLEWKKIFSRSCSQCSKTKDFTPNQTPMAILEPLGGHFGFWMLESNNMFCESCLEHP